MKPPPPTQVLQSSDLAALPGLTAELCAQLRDCSELVSLAAKVERPAPDLLIVLEGEVDVRVPGRAWALETVKPGMVRHLRPLPPATGTFTVVGGPRGARYVAVGPTGLDLLCESAPALIDEFGMSGEGAHAIARILGHRADIDATFLAELGRTTETRRLWPGNLVIKPGERVRALVIVGAGELLLASERVAAGEVLFREQLLSELPAPTGARAGAGGALLLVATRSATGEILSHPRLRTLLDPPRAASSRLPS